MAAFRLLTLGTAGIQDADGEAVPLGLGKAFALLVYVQRTHGPVPREELARLFWASSTHEHARQSVRQALLLLRRVLGEVVFSCEDPVELRPDALITDVEEVAALLDAGDVAGAVRLRRGGFLEGFAISGAPEWDDWVEEERVALDRRLASALEAEAIRLQAEGELDGALECVQQAVQVEPFRASAWEQLFEGLLLARRFQDAAAALTGAERTLAPEALPFDTLHGRLSAARTRDPRSAGGRFRLEFVGRGRELARLRALWTSAAAGAGVGAVVSGPAGVGKTRLVQELAAQVGADGVAVLAKAVEAESGLSWSLLADLVPKLLACRGAAGITDASDDLLRSLVPSMGRPRQETQLPASTFAVAAADALRDLLAAVADEAPLLLALEDTHWCDEQSRLLLTRALRELPDRCMVVVTCRTASSSAESALVLLAPGQPERVPLAPLEPADVLELMSLGVDFPTEQQAERAGVAVYRATGGNPLFIIEMLKAWEAQGLLRWHNGRFHAAAHLDPQRIHAPGSVRRLLVERVAGMPADAGALAGSLARTPRAVPLERVRRELRLSEGAFSKALSFLVDANVLHWAGQERVEFLHDELRAVCRDNLKPSTKWHLGGPVLAAAALALILLVSVAAVMVVGRGNAAYGGGAIYFVAGDSVLVTRPEPDGSLPPPRLFMRFSTRARSAWRTTDGRLHWLSQVVDLNESPYAAELSQQGRTLRTIARIRHSDVAPAGLSPDGQYYTYLRDNPATSAYDVGLMLTDSARRQHRVLLQARSAMGGGYWSPDGSRILAWVQGRTDTVRVLSPTGTVVRSWAFPSAGSAQWCGDRVIAVDAGAERLVLLDPVTGSAERLAPTAVQPQPLACSPDGKAVLYTTVTARRWQTVVQEIGKGSRRIVPVGQLRIDDFFWVPDVAAPVISRVRLDRSDARLRVGESVRLHATADYSDGGHRPEPVEWMSTDPSVVSVSSDGVATGNRPGSARVIASAARWHADTAVVDVQGVLGEGLYLYDDFRTFDARKWIVVGSPMPRAVVEDGEPALFLTGDGQNMDGILSRRAWSFRNGVTAELDFKLPLTRTDRQMLEFCISEANPADSANGVLRQGQQFCLSYPSGQLEKLNPHQMVASSDRAAERVTVSGLPGTGWTHLTIQLRPDGEGTYSINRRQSGSFPLAVSIDDRRKWRVLLFGMSVESRALVRNLQVWEGLRYGARSASGRAGSP